MGKQGSFCFLQIGGQFTCLFSNSISVWICPGKCLFFVFEPTTSYALIVPPYSNFSFYCGNIYFATNNRISPNQIFPDPSQKDLHSHFFKNLVQSVPCSLLMSQFGPCSACLKHQLSRDQNGNSWEQLVHSGNAHKST